MPASPLDLVREQAPAPGAFAAVMATGIVAVAADEHGYPVLSAVLAGFAVAGFVCLGLVVAVRAACGVRPVAGEPTDLGTVLALFSAVAACAVLGARFVAERPVVLAFGVLGLAAWLALVAGAGRAIGLLPAAPRPRVVALRAQVRGASLLPTVATAGLVITVADLRPHTPWVLVAAGVGWALSIVLYAGTVALIAARLADSGLGRELLAGDSWIVMGALAICTLAGDRVLRAAGTAHATAELDAWVRPATFGCWLLASALLLVVLVLLTGGRRHRLGASGRLPRFTVFWWAGVFPQGMYSVATRATARQFHLRVLPSVSALFCWIALLAWLATVAGMLVAARRRQARGCAWE